MKENTFTSIASTEKIVADKNNNNKETLIAELIEEKLLLKEVFFNARCPFRGQKIPMNLKVSKFRFYILL